MWGHGAETKAGTDEAKEFRAKGLAKALLCVAGLAQGGECRPADWPVLGSIPVTSMYPGCRLLLDGACAKAAI